MKPKLTTMERALLDTLDQMHAEARARDTAMSAKIDDLTRQLQQHEASVADLHSLLRPFLPKISLAISAPGSKA
ncbi:hypothetical protein OS189_17075 [Sulfitobacter sp. F26169L]|uniref:hypothetical protein n=1 Tax=Sulfitobacter sp. F26169L TaxID=2996015 RepID=UPI002260B094|nr:hypothetical protein [Sulfitobacter sp. F26169L]MCX7568057.1 hypothetical protein [Sulfitobacter sp. F26169L]